MLGRKFGPGKRGRAIGMWESGVNQIEIAERPNVQSGSSS